MTDLTVLNGHQVMFIGGGNMTTALVDGLLNAKDRYGLDLRLVVSDRNAPKRDAFTNKGVLAVSPEQAPDAIKASDVVVLSVKPQVMAEVCGGLKDALAGKLLVSVAAGLSLEKLSAMTGNANIVRTMPNLPATVGFGATGLFSTQVNDAGKALADAIMAASGVTVWVSDEEKLHAVTAVAGSAPAYFFYVLEHMTAKAVAMGLPKTDARLLATQTMQGAALMAKDADPKDLRAKVTSKGGTTHAAITCLEENKVGTSLALAMQACSDRSVELGGLS